MRSDPREGEPPKSERFYRMETLGSGGNGVVYRALDLTLGVEIAIKYLARPAGRDLYRFKREFRALAEVTHPNLVRLYELFVDDNEWSFTMELVAGLPMRDHLRRAPDSLRSTFLQLADGVSAVHALGKIHRDLKPTNVLVEQNGRVVVLDFGLVRGLDPDEIDHTHEAAAVGTPAFMSPEQALDQPLSAATDWYSVGVMLYEALTGKRPFEGTPADVMRRRVLEDPPRPREVKADVPADLDELCMALLHRDPGKRADATAIFSALGGSRSEATRVLARTVAPAPFVGRTREMAAMRAALAEAEGGTCVFMPVIGPSGMGKSTLVRRFVDALDPANVLAIEGRCYEREHVPYQGIDALVDAAASQLLTRNAQELRQAMPADLPALARLFPSLLRVPAIANLQTARLGPTDPAELRRRAVAAVGDLLGNLAGQRTVVVVLDDMQWSDADGGAVLAELVRYFADVGALFVAASRSAVETPATAGRSARDATPTLQLGHATEPVGTMVTIREVELGPLRADEISELAQVVAPDEDWTAQNTQALVRASGGVPLFVAELAGSADFDSDHAAGADAAIARVMSERIERLPADARALLSACAAAARPLPLETAAAAAGGDAGSALTILRSARLVRTQRLGSQLLVEPYHDSIRRSMVSSLGVGALRAVHRKLATALEGRKTTAATELVGHWLAAGIPDRAVVHARTAARQSEDALAFHVAAELYRTALGIEDTESTGPGDRQELRKRLASCLANSGRLDAAVEVLAEARAETTGAERRALDSQRVEYLLRLGEIERGVAEAQELLGDLGVRIPSGQRAQLVAIINASLMARLRGLRTRLHEPTAADAPLLERIDALWSLTSGMVYVDPQLARLLQLHHLRDALACGEKTRLARALSVEVGYVAQAGSRAGRRLSVVRARAQEIVDEADRPDIHGCWQASLGVAAGICGEWLAADRHCRKAEGLLREHYAGIRWMLNMAQFYRVLSTWYLGRTDELVRLVPAYLADAEAVGDSHALAGLRVGRGNPYWLVADRPEEALAHAIQGWRRRQRGNFVLHDYFQALAEGQVALYQQRWDDALARLDQVQAGFNSSLMKRIQMVRIEWNHLRARASIAVAAASTGAKRAAAIAGARVCVRRLAAERAPWATCLEASNEAALAHLTGNEPAAAAALERAIAAATTSSMALHAEVARHRLGQTRGGTDGKAQVTLADAWMRKHAIVNPAGIVRTLAPGWI